MNTEDISKETYRRMERVLCASWLSFTDLCRHCALEETSMRELTRRPDFPTPSSPTGTLKGRRWAKQEVNAWMEAHKLESIGDVGRL